MVFNITQYIPFLARFPEANQYFWALLVFLGIVILLRIFKFFILQRIKTFAEKTKTDLDDLLIVLIECIGWPLYVLVALYVPLRMLVLPELVQNGIFYLTFLVATYYVVRAFQHLIDYGVKKYGEKQRREDKKADVTVVQFLGRLGKLAVWAVALVLVLANFGYDVSTLIAGLGVGGIAIAFALQNILGDMFASFSLYFDKPFKIGDFIVVGNDSGTVEKIGIKSTRITTLQGEELVCSNKELTEARVRNFGKMKERRVVFSLGLTYDTSSAKLKKVPGIIKKVFEKVKKANLSRVHFQKFGDFSLNYEIVYYVKSGNYVDFMDVQQAVNLAIKAEFEKEKIEMAFPTQTLYLEKN